MVRVAVCDDNKVFLEMLVRMVKEKLEEYNVANRITDYMSGTVFLEHHKKEPFDIVFLDIIMPDMDGFEVAKEIRKISEKTYIIFVTTERSLVYDVFDFEAFDFVPKDSFELLEGKLNRVINRLSEHLSAYMKICLDISLGEKKVIEPCEIVWVQSKENYVDYVLITGEKLHIRGTIDSVLKILSPRLFVRIHNRNIVNMMHIIRIDYPNNEVIMRDSQRISISRKYKNELDMMYIKFNKDFR